MAALSDINAFNAGKKRDKALSLLSAWLPDVEKFTREIGKQNAYIDSLKKKIGQESDYAGRLRDEKYAEELKVQKRTRRYLSCSAPISSWNACLGKSRPKCWKNCRNRIETGQEKGRKAIEKTGFYNAED